MAFGVGGDSNAFGVEFAAQPDEDPVTHLVDLTDGQVVDPAAGNLWPVADRRPPGTTGSASDIALDSDGRLLMVRGDDETLRFYDVATRTQLGDAIDLDRFFGESAALLGPDGLQAAAVTGQGIVIWDLDPGHWISAACQVAGRNLTHAEWDQYIGDLAPYRQTCGQYPEGA